MEFKDEIRPKQPGDVDMWTVAIPNFNPFALGKQRKYSYRRRTEMKIKLDEGAYMPERAHDTDAGLDIRARDGAHILPHSSEVFETGVHVELPKGYAGLIVSKSGLNVNHDITSTGLIDEGYQGQIVVKLFNGGDIAYDVYRGDKISQLVIIPVRYEPIEVAEEISGGDRGNNGFGSTGR